MKYTATAGLALSAFVLAGCNDELSTEEAQEQLDAAFEQVDNLPEFDTTRFTEFVDEDGNCVASYDDHSKGVYIETDYRKFASYVDSFFPYDCGDLPALRSAFDTTVDIYDYSTQIRSDVDVAQERAEFKRELTESARNTIWSIEGISTFGLE